MLIDLHAHAPHPDYYNQHPHWGPFFEQCSDGDIRLRVGHWVLTLGLAGAQGGSSGGQGPEARGVPGALGRSRRSVSREWTPPARTLQVVSVPSHCYMYWTEPEYAVPFARKVNDVLAEYCAAAPSRLMFWAHAPLNVPLEAAKELRRACTATRREGTGRWRRQFRRPRVRLARAGSGLGGAVRPRLADVHPRLQPVGHLGREGQRRSLRDDRDRRHAVRRDALLLESGLRRRARPLPESQGVHHARRRLRALPARTPGANEQESRRRAQQEAGARVPEELLVRRRAARSADAPGAGRHHRRRPAWSMAAISAAATRCDTT